MIEIQTEKSRKARRIRPDEDVRPKKKANNENFFWVYNIYYIFWDYYGSILGLFSNTFKNSLNSSLQKLKFKV